MNKDIVKLFTDSQDAEWNYEDSVTRIMDEIDVARTRKDWTRTNKISENTRKRLGSGQKNRVIEFLIRIKDQILNEELSNILASITDGVKNRFTDFTKTDGWSHIFKDIREDARAHGCKIESAKK